MSRLGMVCPPMHGHMHPMFSLGRELVRRGHEVTVFTLPDAEPHAHAAGLRFQPIGAREFPAGSLKEQRERLARMSGLAAVKFTLRLIRREATIHLAELPEALRAAGIQMLLTDQVAPAAGTAAQVAGIPFVTICNALMLNTELSVPPIAMNWLYRDSWAAAVRNAAGHGLLRLLAQPIWNEVNAFRRAHGLPPNRHPNDWSSPIGTIAQVPGEFDFPRKHLPATFHYAGPFLDPAARTERDFPYHRLDGRPLVYASMGTLQNGVASLFRCIAQACEKLPVQLVLALGGGSPESLEPLAGSPIVVPYAPQLELLQRASLTVTHAGLNTVLESLAAGVPMVAIPITNDQPGAAARLVWCGAGERILPRRLTAPRLREAIARVLNEPAYRQNARRLQAAIRASGGAVRAADLIDSWLPDRKTPTETETPARTTG